LQQDTPFIFPEFIFIFTKNSAMAQQDARNNILNRITSALAKSTINRFAPTAEQADVFRKETGSLDNIFAKKFTGLMGQYAFCKNASELAQQLSAIITSRGFLKISCTIDEVSAVLEQAGIAITSNIHEADAAVTDCICLVARTGSVVLSAAQSSGRILPIYAPAHIVIAKQNQLYYDTGDAISFLAETYQDQLPSSIHFVAGPSRTGDIEKTLVTGVHGPKEVFVFLLPA
jgi:L-lactate dehydrogenase complex protein LldG